MSESIGLIPLTLRSMLGSMLIMDEIDVVRTGNKVKYTILTSSFGKPGSRLAENLLNIKTKIYSLAPPVNMLEIVNMLPMEEGKITSRYKLVLEGKFTEQAVRAFKRRQMRKQRRRK